LPERGPQPEESPDPNELLSYDVAAGVEFQRYLRPAGGALAIRDSSTV
jgi:hypothetical protein